MRIFALFAFALVLVSTSLAADEPKQKPQNTIHLDLPEPVTPQAFSRRVTFFVDKVIDRSGNAQPQLVLNGRGGIFIDREPTEVMRSALEASLKSGNVLAPSKEAADYVLDIYLFHFGLAAGVGMDYFGKVELNIVMKSKSGKSQQITALGTSLGNAPMFKKNVQKALKANLEQAIQAALRNFLRGTQLRNAVAGKPVQASIQSKESSHV